MSRESELQRPTPLSNGGAKGDLVEHELPGDPVILKTVLEIKSPLDHRPANCNP